jgi:hypothetical protein
MLDPDPHFGLGAVFRPLDLIDNTAVAAAAIGEIAGLGRMIPDHRPLAAIRVIGEVPARILGHSFPPGLEMPPTPTAIFPLTKCPGRRNVVTKQWARDDGARQWT